MNCGACTFENPPNTTICEMCSKSIKPIESNISENWNGIQCDACTFLNHSDADICECCGSDIYVDGEEENIFVSQHEVEEQLIDVASNTKDQQSSTDETQIECPQNKCELCCEAMGTDYFAMFECTHTFCYDCAVNYFTIQITERPIFDCICPMCNLPELRTNEDKHEEYFSLLLASLTPVLDENIMNVFEKKLTDLALSSDPNFLWCIRCTSGFVNNLQVKVVHCPDCRVKFCTDCKKIWQSQHTGISCEQFANWQRDNNPELSHEAIGNYLQKNGIECPKCKFKYDLSRGGCIHFTCTQCRYEFCFGCSKPFLRSCTVSKYCQSVGLHAHHERNCFYYLRYKNIADLQGLLKVNNIKFVTTENLMQTANGQQNCPIELQIESGKGIVDSICSEETEKGHGGLCENHYKEYLIVMIAKAKLETNSILSVHNYHELLRYQGIAIPTQSATQKDNEYKDLCEKLVRNNIPLQR